MEVISNSIILLGSLAIIFAFVLGMAAKKFYIKTDPREEIITNLLPRANCGACGYAGCNDYTRALISNEAEIGKCALASKDAYEEICKLLGKTMSELERRVAVILCAGGKYCIDEFVYEGIESCVGANLLFRGQKACKYGCLCFGDCVVACPVGAISFSKGNIPAIDLLKCTGCGLCVNVCPKKIITLVPCKYQVHIQCSSADKGVMVKNICSVGCIGCGVCVKSCLKTDILLQNNLAKMKYVSCDNCGYCIKKCPTNSINSFTIVSRRKEA